MSKQDGILDLVVKGEWFDKIKSGEKTHEFREINRYWDQRLEKSLYPIEWKNGDFSAVKSSPTCYAWFVWQKGFHDGKTIIDRV